MSRQTTTEMQRDLHPHKAAVAAMCLFGRAYAAQRGGSMTFWDSLGDSDKQVCRDLVARIDAASPEPSA